MQKSTIMWTVCRFCNCIAKYQENSVQREFFINLQMHIAPGDGSKSEVLD